MIDAPNSSAAAREELLALLLAEEGYAPPDTSAAVLPRSGAAAPPLSFAQWRLWFLHRLAPRSPAYNIATAVRLRGPLAPAALRGSLAGIIRRHEALRTRFAERGGQPVQIVEPPMELTLRRVDLRALEPGPREAALQDHLKRAKARPFDLAAGPLVRFILLRCGDDDHVLSAVAHHIVADGWSMGILTRELTELYAALRRGAPSPLPELRVQYADFAVWQRRQLAGRACARDLEFWRRELGGHLPVLELATDHPRPAVPSFRGASVTRRLPRELADELGAFARQEGATLFMVLDAAFAVLLHRHCGQDDLLVGTPVANRHRPEIENLIGFFVNTLVLRTYLAGDPGFREVLARVRTTALDAFAHQALPFDLLVEELQPERSPSRQPLFQVMFALENAPIELPRLGELTIERLPLAEESAKFDLTLKIEESRDGLEARLEYSTDLFEPASAERLMSQLERLLRAALAAPERRLSELPLISGAERERLIRTWNETAEPHPATSVLELFARQVGRRPDAVALVVEGAGELTYGELDRRSNRLGRYLRGLGIGPEMPVGVAFEGARETVVALWAILKAGGVYLPLDPALPAERLARMLADAEAAVLLTEPAVLESLPLSFAGMVAAGDALWDDVAAESAAALDGGPRGGRLAYLICTSGSTGRPKGVAVSHAALANYVRAAWSRLDLAACASFAMVSTFAADLGHTVLFPALVHGRRLHLFPRRAAMDPETVARHLAEHAVDGMKIVPSHLRMLLAARDTRRVLPRRRLVLGGEAVPWELIDRARELAPDCVVYNHYGPSEVTVGVLARQVDEGAHSARGATVPIGRPLPNNRVYLLDAGLRPVPVGMPGEICLAGANLARGYLGSPRRTAPAFIPDPWSGAAGGRLYRTGDRGRWLPTGEVEILGRVDRQVKVRGYRVELGEIEAALAEDPRVEQAVVLCRPAPGGDQRLVAWWVGNAQRAAAAELRDGLRARLPEYMVPAAFVALGALPLTPNGKIDDRALPDPGAAEGSQRDDGGGPADSVEEVIAGVWRDLLGGGRVEHGDDFFDLGGHSVLATRVMSRLEQIFEIEMPLLGLFETPTVAGLAQQVKRRLRSAGGERVPPLVPVARTRDLPLSFAQQRLWFLDLLEPGSTAYIMPAALRVSGPLDLAAFARSLREIAVRHEVLRTTFEKVAGRSRAVVAAAPSFALPILDLRRLPPERREAEGRRLINEQAGRPFDLGHGPLLRACLARLGPEDALVVLSIHHIVCDGWSIGIVIRELAALYKAFAAGRPAPLPPLPVQYADYAAWQREWLQGAVLEAQLAYWRDQLGVDPAPLELPTDRPHPPLQTYRGRRLDLQLSPALSDALAELARRHDATLFMLLSAAFLALLHRYSDPQRIALGTPIAGRNRPELEDLIGFFVNTLVLAVDLDGDAAFIELLERMRRAALGAYAHQDVPFEYLVDELQPERNLSRSPLFQVMFVWQNIPIPFCELEGATLQPLAPAGETAKFELTLSLQPGSRGLFGTLEYNTDLFVETTVRRLAGHLQTLLAGLVEAPQRRLGELPLFTAAERWQLLAEWNRPALSHAPRASFIRRFAAQVERAPDAVATAWGRTAWSFRHLDAQADALAAELVRCGVGPDDVVALLDERGSALLAAILAVFKAGAAYLPLDPRHPQRRHLQVLERSAAVVALAGSDFAPGLAAAAAQHPALAPVRPLRFETAAAGAAVPWDPGEALNLAYVIFTSGSTGVPKGVMIPRSGLLNHLDSKLADFSLGPTDVVAQTATQCFDISVWQFLAPLLAGARMEIPEDEITHDPRRLLDELELRGVTHWETVPSFLAAILDEIERRGDARPVLPRLRGFLTTGEALPPELCRRWLARTGIPVINAYGPAECSDDVAQDRIVEPPASACVAIGRPIANTALHVVDQRLGLRPIGVSGELLVSGTGVGRGYLHAPRQTAARFVPDPFSRVPGERLYRTGDQVRRLADGRLEYQGRFDHQVKIRGYRIELGEIEAALARHPAVCEAVVLAHRAASGDAELVACLTGAGAEPSAAELHQYLRERLPDYMVPACFVVLASLPTTPNGKVDRKALAALEHRRLVPQTPHVAPRNLLELQLAEIFGDTLDSGTVGITDSFFELGGHSLLAVRLMALVEERLGLELPLSVLFQGPTVEHLALLLRERPGTGLWSPLVAIRPEGGKIPLFCIHPTGGDVLCYHHLAQLLGPDQPFYALQARGLNGREEPRRDLQAMAADYLREVRAVRPRGPYQLGGWSFGGVVAYEMARQLRAMGEEVGFLAIFDSLAPIGETGTAAAAELGGERWTQWFLTIAGEFERVVQQDLDLVPDELRGRPPEDQLEEFVARLGRIDFLPPGAGRSLARGFWRVHEANVLALWRYAREAGSYDGPVTLFRSAEALLLDESWSREAHAGEALGWDRLAAGALVIEPVPGDHNTLLASPFVEVLAERLAVLLAEAGAPAAAIQGVGS